VTAFWRASGAQPVVDWLDAGADDGFAEEQVGRGCAARLCRRESGGVEPRHHAFLIELVRAESPEAFRRLPADLLLSDLFAPWQGIAVWSALDLRGLGARQRSGLGSQDGPGVLEATGWYAVVPPERAMT
jgi:hypothetical protein